MKASSSKRKPIEPLEQGKRLEIVSELASIAGISKGGLSKTLKALHDMGLLTDALTGAKTDRGYSRQVQRAFEWDALERQTPFGPMLCEEELPNDQPKKRRNMYYLSPFALLFTISNVSFEFFRLMRQAVGPTGTNVLRIVLYLDGINPANPLAPDPQLLLQAIYWTFLELPNWFLRRKAAWFVFSLDKEHWTEELRGTLSELSKCYSHGLFPATRGIVP